MPSEAATSSWAGSMRRRAATAGRNTYGKVVSVRTRTAPREAGQAGRDVEPHEGADVARDRQREHQRDLPGPRAGQVGARDQPRRSDADQRPPGGSRSPRARRCAGSGPRVAGVARTSSEPGHASRSGRSGTRSAGPPRRRPRPRAPRATTAPEGRARGPAGPVATGAHRRPVPGPTRSAGPGTGSFTVGAAVTAPSFHRRPGGAGTRPTGSAARPRPAAPASRRSSPGRTGRSPAGRGTPATAGPRGPATPSISGYSNVCWAK